MLAGCRSMRGGRRKVARPSAISKCYDSRCAPAKPCARDRRDRRDRRHRRLFAGRRAQVAAPRAHRCASKAVALEGQGRAVRTPLPRATTHGSSATTRAPPGVGGVAPAHSACQRLRLTDAAHLPALPALRRFVALDDARPPHIGIGSGRCGALRGRCGPPRC